MKNKTVERLSVGLMSLTDFGYAAIAIYFLVEFGYFALAGDYLFMPSDILEGDKPFIWPAFHYGIPYAILLAVSFTAGVIEDKKDSMLALLTVFILVPVLSALLFIPSAIIGVIMFWVASIAAVIVHLPVALIAAGFRINVTSGLIMIGFVLAIVLGILANSGGGEVVETIIVIFTRRK